MTMQSKTAVTDTGGREALSPQADSPFEMYSQAHRFPTYREVLAAAREHLPPAAWEFLEGGAGDEVTMRRNREAFDRWTFRPQLMSGAFEPDTSTTFMGQELGLPILTAPFGVDGLFHPDGHVAVARANARMGSMSIVPIAGTHPLETVAAVPVPKLFQFHPAGPPEEIVTLFRRAEAAGYQGFCVTMDCPVGGWRERIMREPFMPPMELVTGSVLAQGEQPHPTTLAKVFPQGVRPWNWAELADVLAETTLPVLCKGILTAQDAVRSVEAGASAVLVSNHGGRQLDGAPPALDQLSDIVAAVGDRAEVLVDSGVRRGADIVKALALGARGVVIGRPAAVGLAADGEDGVARVIELLRDEMRVVMALIGAQTTRDISRSHIAPYDYAPSYGGTPRGEV